MANSLKGRIWKLDTASATPVTTEPQNVKSIRWVNASGVTGDTAVIKDPDGAVLWDSVQPGANFVEYDLLETWWSRGFAVTTLASGTLYLTLK